MTVGAFRLSPSYTYQKILTAPAAEHNSVSAPALRWQECLRRRDLPSNDLLKAEVWRA